MSSCLVAVVAAFADHLHTNGWTWQRVMLNVAVKLDQVCNLFLDRLHKRMPCSNHKPAATHWACSPDAGSHCPCRRPHLQGRFSGRLATKEDERRLAEECRLLGPLLGGVGKRGDRSRLTLAKIVRGIAEGSIRKHCEERETMVAVSHLFSTQGCLCDTSPHRLDVLVSPAARCSRTLPPHTGLSLIALLRACRACGRGWPSGKLLAASSSKRSSRRSAP